MSQDVLSVIASFFGSLGFAIIYNIRGRRVWIPAIGGDHGRDVVEEADRGAGAHSS